MSQIVAKGPMSLSDTAPRGLRGPAESWRILVAENAADDAECLIRGLRRHGHDVMHAETGIAVLDAYEGMDLLLIDLDLPDLDGLEVCRDIRAACDVAIIAVTGRASELDRVLGLQAGADDYLVKPYGFRELMARMEAVMRRAQRHSPEARVISHGPLCIDVGLREVRMDGRRIEMTRKEFDLLHILAARPDTVIPRKQLMQRIWGDSWSRRTVDTHVNRLRNKLGSGDWIVTVRGIGFRFHRA
ncbi:response regulator transcription factor [Streptomyces sp. NPDC057456]|uniref:response regulator transcription factor n=1 Tax=Streptomyces sp. NPDC057456 TaxID=3346139 RepID=UPI0036C7D5B0